MPRTLLVNTPEVSPQVSQGAPYINLNVNPDQFGAGIARAIGRVAEATMQTGDLLAQNALRMQEITNESAARDTFNKAWDTYQRKSAEDGVYSKKPAQLYGEGQKPVDVYNNAMKEYSAAGEEFGNKLENPRARLLFNKAWGDQGRTEMGRASHFAQSSQKEFTAEGLRAFQTGHDQTVATLATQVEQNWHGLAGAESAAATNLRIGGGLGMAPDAIATEARKSADTLRGAAIRGWFNEQPDLDKAAEQLTLGKINNPEAQAILDRIDPKQREGLTSHLLESRHKLAVINNANRAESDRVQKQAAESSIQSIFLDPKLSTSDRQAKLDALRGNIHVPIETLRKADDFIRDGGRSAAINVESDNLNVELAIRSDVIKTDNDLINYISGASPDGTTHAPLQVSTEMMRTRLLPMVTSKRDKSFNDIVEAGMRELGFDKSLAASGMQINVDKTEKALKFSSDMTYYRLDHPDADFRSAARGMLDATKKQANVGAQATVPILADAYRAALKTGNASDIANKKSALGVALEQSGVTDALSRSASDFDPIAALDAYTKKKAAQ